MDEPLRTAGTSRGNRHTTLANIVRPEPVDPHCTADDLGAGELKLPEDFRGAAIEVDVLVRVQMQVPAKPRPSTVGYTMEWARVHATEAVDALIRDDEDMEVVRAEAYNWKAIPKPPGEKI